MNGTPFEIKSDMLGDRFLRKFWSKVEKTDTCWNWVGGVTGSRYGVIRVPVIRRRVLCHRVSFALANANTPALAHICHTCDNPRCVRPEHLFSGDAKVNAVDRVSKGRQRSASPPELRGAIVLMARRGMSAIEIASWVTLSHSCISRILAEDREVAPC